MTGCANEHGSEPLTRRQIRERERASMSQVADTSATEVDAFNRAVYGLERIVDLPNSVSDIPDQIVDAFDPVVGIPELVADLSDPVAEVSDPVADAFGPVADVSDPVADVADPVVDLSDPVADLSDPVAEVSDPAADVSGDETVTLPPLTRRELRSQSAVAECGERRSRVTLAPRIMIAATLGALTIAVPLTGLVGKHGGDEAYALPEVSATDSHIVPAAAGFTDAVAAQEADGKAALPAALQADPAAVSRATSLAASRSLNRTIGACEPQVDGASGLRAALQERDKTKLFMPLKQGSYRNTSDYGERVHPVFGTVSKHEGTDLAAPIGTPIYAVADGVVKHAGNGIQGRSSMLIIIEHQIDGKKVQTWYVHMFREGVFVKEGQKVKAGQVIGGVGNNGNSTGPHLHFEVHTGANMDTISPLPWLKQIGAVNPGSC